MGQATNRSASEALDLVITNALIIDWSGIFKVLYWQSSQPVLLIEHLYLGRYWCQEWLDCRPRKGWESGCHGWRPSLSHNRFKYRSDRRRKVNCHCWGYRCTHPLHLTDASHWGSCSRYHNNDWWRNWTKCRHQRDNMYTKPILYSTYVIRYRYPTNELRLHGERKRCGFICSGRHRKGWRCRLEVTWRLGLDPGDHHQLPERGGRLWRPGLWWRLAEPANAKWRAR